MKAAVYARQGAAAKVLHIVDVPTPEPSPGEVLIRVRASGINPSDTKSRAGVGGRTMPFPSIIPHSDGAGEIVAVGAGVSPRRLGERVWIWNGQWRRPHGTAAEYIALASEQAVALPDHMSFLQGACLGIPATTAAHGVNLARCHSGNTVLVSGGAGNVGRNAVHFASRSGARTVATVSSREKATVAQAAGADVTIEYRSEPVAERVSALTQSTGVDVVIEVDLAVNSELIESCLRPHGTVVVYGLSGNVATLNARWLLQNSITVHFIFAYELSSDDRRAAIEKICASAEQGALVPLLFDVLPLERVADAHEIVESGRALGHVVLEML